MAHHVNLSRGLKVTTIDGTKCQINTERHGGWTTGWLAKIDTQGNRSFLTPATKSLSCAGNGDLVYHVDPGIYEAESVYRSFRAERWVIEVAADGTAKILDDNFVKELQTKARDAATQQAKAEAQSQGLPELVGTEKQVAWAERLRLSRLVEAENVTLPGFCEWLKAQRAAKWWIDSRQAPLRALLEQFETACPVTA